MARVDVLLLEDLGQQRLPARTLAAVLERAGLHARLVDWRPGEGHGAVVALAQALQPRLIVASILFAHGVREHLALYATLRRAGVAAHRTMAGPLPTLAWRELLAASPDLDSVLCGEPEANLASLAAALDGSTRWQAVPGLAYRAPAPTANPLPPPLRCLEDLPCPLRDDGNTGVLSGGFATVEAGRGCYHRCTFCLPCALHQAIAAPAYRLRPAKHVAAEIAALQRQGVRLVLFDDEQFLPPPRARQAWLAAFEQALGGAGVRIAFTIKCRADDVEPALFRQLQALGLVRVYVGIESGHAPTLELLGKGTSPAQNAAALAALDRLGIVADFRSLAFHPWSTLDSVRAELDFLERVRPHVATCFCFRELEVYPGTLLAVRLRAEGRGAGAPWPLPYTLADPRTELLRRLARLAFDPAGPCERLQGAVTQAWFDLLLARRFEGAAGAATAARLRAAVAAANRAALAVWREMLAFAAEDDVYDTQRVNDRAAAWARRVAASCAEGEAAVRA